MINYTNNQCKTFCVSHPAFLHSISAALQLCLSLHLTGLASTETKLHRTQNTQHVHFLQVGQFMGESLAQMGGLAILSVNEWNE